jgi:hypothetical protein
MRPNEETTVSKTALRYTSRRNGSEFQGLGYGGELLSCIKCGQHRPRSKGTLKRYAYGLFFYCVDCRPQLKN